MHSLGIERSPTFSDNVGIACPCQRIVLLMVIVVVVELIVMTRVDILIEAFAVASCDIEHVAIVCGLFYSRWPAWR